MTQSAEWVLTPYPDWECGIEVESIILYYHYCVVGVRSGENVVSYCECAEYLIALNTDGVCIIMLLLFVPPLRIPASHLCPRCVFAFWGSPSLSPLSI